MLVLNPFSISLPSHLTLLLTVSNGARVKLHFFPLKSKAKEGKIDFFAKKKPFVDREKGSGPQLHHSKSGEFSPFTSA